MELFEKTDAKSWQRWLQILYANSWHLLPSRAKALSQWCSAGCTLPPVLQNHGTSSSNTWVLGEESCKPLPWGRSFAIWQPANCLLLTSIPRFDPNFNLNNSTSGILEKSTDVTNEDILLRTKLHMKNISYQLNNKTKLVKSTC